MAVVTNNDFIIQKQEWDDFTIYLIANQHSCIHLIIMNDDHVKDNGGEKATIYGLWVDKEYRRQGIGSHLIKMVEDIARQNEIDYVYLSCLVKSDDDKFVFDWYKRMNYVEVGYCKSNPEMHVVRKKLN